MKIKISSTISDFSKSSSSLTGTKRIMLRTIHPFTLGYQKFSTSVINLISRNIGWLLPGCIALMIRICGCTEQAGAEYQSNLANSNTPANNCNEFFEINYPGIHLTEPPEIIPFEKALESLKSDIQKKGYKLHGNDGYDDVEILRLISAYTHSLIPTGLVKEGDDRKEKREKSLEFNRLNLKHQYYLAAYHEYIMACGEYTAFSINLAKEIGFEHVFRLDVGTDEYGHVTSLYKVVLGGHPKYLIFDSHYTIEFSDSLGYPKDYLEMTTELLRDDTSNIRIVNIDKVYGHQKRLIPITQLTRNIDSTISQKKKKNSFSKLSQQRWMNLTVTPLIKQKLFSCSYNQDYVLKQDTLNFHEYLMKSFKDNNVFAQKLESLRLHGFPAENFIGIAYWYVSGKLGTPQLNYLGHSGWEAKEQVNYLRLKFKEIHRNAKMGDSLKLVSSPNTQSPQH